MSTPAREYQTRKRILLLDNGRARNLHSLLLYTAGYEIEATGNEAEAHTLCRSMLPELVLVSANQSLSCNWDIAWKLQRGFPQQRIAFQYTDTVQLCPLYNNGKLIQKAEGPDDLLERVAALIGAAAHVTRQACFQ